MFRITSCGRTDPKWPGHARFRRRWLFSAIPNSAFGDTRSSPGRADGTRGSASLQDQAARTSSHRVGVSAGVDRAESSIGLHHAALRTWRYRLQCQEHVLEVGRVVRFIGVARAGERWILEVVYGWSTGCWSVQRVEKPLGTIGVIMNGSGTGNDAMKLVLLSGLK